MSFYLEEEIPFVKKANSMKLDALNNGKVTLTRFLNSREQELLDFVIGKHTEVNCFFSCVYKEEEYKRAIITPFKKGVDFKVVILKLNYNKRYLSLNHRNVLGALMSLSIERNTVGDIVFTANEDCYILATKEISSFLISEFRMLSHQAIELEIVDNIEGEIKSSFEEKSYFVASLRLDLLASERFNLSRQVCQEMIVKGDCKVNQKPINNTSHILKEGDVISLKGYGRMKLLEVGGLSKNNKIFVRLGKAI